MTDAERMKRSRTWKRVLDCDMQLEPMTEDELVAWVSKPRWGAEGKPARKDDHRDIVLGVLLFAKYGYPRALDDLMAAFGFTAGLSAMMEARMIDQISAAYPWLAKACQTERGRVIREYEREVAKLSAEAERTLGESAE